MRVTSLLISSESDSAALAPLRAYLEPILGRRQDEAPSGYRKEAKLTRRDKGAGTILDLGDGRYRLMFEAGKDPMTGKRRRMSPTIRARNLTEAKKELHRRQAEVALAMPGTSGSVQALLEQYVRHLRSVGRAPLTISEAERIIARVLVPRIGSIPLDELTVRHVDLLLADLAHLKPATRKRYFAVLSAALSLAVRWEYVPVNVASRATLPPAEAAELVLPTRADLQALLEAMPSEVWQMAIELAVLTGCRRGEICALRWSDISDGVVTVRRSAYRLAGQTHEKSTKSRRVREVGLAGHVQELLAGWAQWCEDRAAQVNVVLGKDGFILSTWPDLSRPLNPDSLTAVVSKAAQDAGIPHVHFHSLRHVAASTMLEAGVSVRQVAETLGHVDGGKLALQVYGHGSTAGQKAAADAMASFLVREPSKTKGEGPRSPVKALKP